MALRIAWGRRFVCTSTVSSHFPASLAAAAAEAARNTPTPVPSDILFVSGLNKRTTNEKLHKVFSNFGQAVHAKVATDRNNGYSKGYGFVKYATGLKGWMQSFWKAG